jgi:phosphoribosylformimino-5-aminoimidazole carboxamide ribotide isomerase
MIIIPAIDIIEGRCVRLTRGERATRKIYDGDPVDAAKRWADAGAERIHVVDLDGAFDGVSKNLEAIERIAAAVDAPVEVGGGIRDPKAVEAILGAGASFVVIGTLAVERPGTAAEIIESYPGQVYIGIDARAGMVATHGWVKTSERSIVELLDRAAEWGARGVIFTAIERDGELIGPDFEAIESVVAKAKVPIVASGGVSKIEDITRLAAIPRLEGAIIGKCLYEGRVVIEEALKAAERPPV